MASTYAAMTQRNLKRSVAESGGSMKNLIDPAAPEPIKTVQADPSANISGALQDVTTARAELPGAKEVTTQQTVAGQMRELLDSDSPYLRQAREQGLRYAASRGMGSSALAAGHSQQSAISAALPIASQDAATFAQAARQYQGHLEGLIQQANAGDITAQLQLQNAGYNSQLSAQEHTQRLVESAQAGDINARLQLQQAMQAADLSQQGHLQSSELQASQHGHERGMQKNLFGHEQSMQSSLFGHQRQMQAAGFSHEQSMQARAESHQVRMQEMAQSHSKVMESIQQNNRIDLQGREFQHAQSMFTQQLQHAVNMSEREAQQWMAQQNTLHSQTLQQIDAQAAASGRVDRQQQAAAIQAQYLGQVSQLQVRTSAELTDIYTREGLTAQQQQNAAAVAQNRFNQDLQLLRTQYQSSPFWDASW